MGDQAAAVLLPVPAAHAGAQVRRWEDPSLPRAPIPAEGRPACPGMREADPRLHRRADTPADQAGGDTRTGRGMVPGPGPHQVLNRPDFTGG